MKTYSAKPSDIKRKWHEVDASDKVLGRLASQVARLLIGKHKAMFTPNQDTGDYVVVTNASKIRVSGNKMKQKLYYHHSGYPGGLKTTSLEEMMKTSPVRVVEHAIKGMLPRNRLGAQMFRKLRVYAGDAHPHPVQKEDASKMVKV